MVLAAVGRSGAEAGGEATLTLFWLGTADDVDVLIAPSESGWVWMLELELGFTSEGLGYSMTMVKSPTLEASRMKSARSVESDHWYVSPAMEALRKEMVGWSLKEEDLNARL